MSHGSKFFQKDEDSQEEQETQPKSKFFQNSDSGEEEEQKPAKSKFFAKNDDELSDPEYDDPEKEPADQPKQSKFFSKNDESSEEGQDTKKKSKFFGGSDDENEEKEAKPTKSKFFNGGDDSEEEPAKKSKFFAGGEDEEGEEDADDKAPATSKNGKGKGDKEKNGKKGKKKGKGKQKDESESEDDEQKVEQTELKKDDSKKEADPEKDEDDINIDEIDFDGPKKKSRNQKKKEKLKAKKEGGGKEEAKTEEPSEKTGETKPAEAKGKIEVSKPKPEENKRKADEKKVKIEETKPVDPNVKPEETKTEKADAKKDDGKKDNKKGKKQSAAALKIQEMQEKKRKQEEEEKKRLEEIQRQLREQQEREEAEERARKEEEEKRRKEREAKKQKMIDEGTYKTKKEREREIFAQQAREQFLQSGMIRAVAEEGGEKKGSKVVSTRKKKPPQKKPDDAASTHTATTAEDTEAKGEGDNHPEPQIISTTHETKDTAQEQQQPAVDDVEDDWMTLADDKKEPEAKADDKKGSKAKADDKKESETKADEKKDTQTAQPEEKISKKDDKTKKSKDEKTIPSNETEQPSTSKKSKDLKNKRPKADTTEEESKGEPILRSPICCIMGHVDTGKTKLLDKMRNTNVQEGEAGGITQQIGATFFPREKLESEVVKITDHYNMKLNVPGLLVIDTPGHESFSNLRSRGSGLCDIVILVIDIMHGIQRQTLEAIELVKMRKTPYVIALNKIDRLYGWKATQGASSYVSLMKQNRDVKLEFEDRVKKIITSLNENSLNVALYYDNPNVDEYASIIPTSAISGEGIPDLLGVVIRLTQRWLRKKIQLKDEFKCSVLEVKVIEGLGATIDCLLVNGTLREGDTIALNTFKGPISTSIRALLTPHPMKEMRVKGEYVHHKEIKAAMGIKICADDLGEAVAGSDMYLVERESELQTYMDILKEEVKEIKNRINTTSEGVSVAASTLGSLEALLQFLKTSKIPVSNICIGPVSKEEVIRAMKPLLTEDKKVKKEYATILAFDVKVLPDALAYADSVGVKIMTANIIYHLFDQFTAYLKEIKEKKRLEEGKAAVFPCIIKPVAFFNKKDPIIMGIDVLEGVLKIGTPLVLLDKDKTKIGVVESIEREHKSIQQARPADGSVAIRLSGDTSITCGRHFELKDKLASLLSRESLDALKEHFRDDVSKTDWDLVRKLKPFFGIL